MPEAARSEVPIDAVQAAFLRETIPLDQAYRALADWTQDLVDNTVFEGSKMVKDSMGFNGADYHNALTYLSLVAEDPAAYPAATHAAWAKELVKYGDTQLGGVDRVLRFLRRLEAEADADGTSIPDKLVRVDHDPQRDKGGPGVKVPGGRFGFGQMDPYRGRPGRTGMWANVGGYRDLMHVLNAAGLQGLARPAKHDRRWVMVFDLADAEQIARKLERFSSDLAPLAEAVRAAAPVYRVRQGVDPAAQPAEPPKVDPSTLPLTGGRLGPALAVSWREEDPRVFRIATPYRVGDTIAWQVPGNMGIPSQFRPEGKIPWREYPLDAWKATASAYREAGMLPTLVAALETLGPQWDKAARVEVSDDAQKRAKALVRRFRHMMDPALLDADGDLPSARRENLIRAATTLQDIEPGASSADIGPYGSWVRSTYKGKDVINVYTPFEFKDWRNHVRTVRTMKDRNGQWYTAVDLRKVPQVARALEKVGNDPLAMSIRLALLTDALALQVPPELEELADAVFPSDLSDATRRKVEAIVKPAADRLTPPYTFYPYQMNGIAFLALANHRGYIADDMGTGKTLMTIGALLTDPKRLLPAVVIAPANTLYNWRSEIRRFGGRFLRPRVVDSPDQPIHPQHPQEVTILSWGRLQGQYSVEEQVTRAGFKTAVFDEAHKGKRIQASRTKAMIQIAHNVPHVYMLSGTPIENHAGEAWTQLHAIDPTAFPSKKEFEAKYKSQTKRGVQMPDGSLMVYSDVRGDEDAELRDALRGYMIRRTKSEVFPDMPAKVRQPINLSMTPEQRKRYKADEDAFIRILCANWRFRRAMEAAKYALDHEVSLEAAARWANSEDGPSLGTPAEALQKITAMRQVVGEMKVPYVVDRILAYREQSGGKPVIVFAKHKGVVNAIAKALKKHNIDAAVVGAGKNMTAKRKGAIAQAFQAGQIPVLIATKALVEGQNLTAASRGIFAERWWVPTQEEQAEDRMHRIGQDETVVVEYLQMDDTIDDYMAEIVDSKRSAISGVVKQAEVEGRAAISQADLQHEGESLQQAIMRRAIARANLGARCTVSPGDVVRAIRKLRASRAAKASKRQKR